MRPGRLPEDHPEEQAARAALHRRPTVAYTPYDTTLNRLHQSPVPTPEEARAIVGLAPLPRRPRRWT